MVEREDKDNIVSTDSTKSTPYEASFIVAHYLHMAALFYEVAAHDDAAANLTALARRDQNGMSLTAGHQWLTAMAELYKEGMN